jgi:hypothetical protein
MHSKSETLNDFASGSVVRNLNTCERVTEKCLVIDHDEVQGSRLARKDFFLLRRREEEDTLGRVPKEGENGDWAGAGRSGGSLGGKGADRGKK